MKKIWLPTWLYNVKPLLIGIVGAAFLFYSKDLFTTSFGALCLGYAGWIILIRLIYAATKFVKTGIGSDKNDKDKTHYANFPDE